MTKDELWEKYASSNGVPFEYVIWDAQECADYLGISKSRFLRYRRYNEGFPKMVTKEDERPRWRAADVVAWRLGYDRITTVAA